MANEGVVVPFILEDVIGTCIPLNPFLKLVRVMYDSDASENAEDHGVVGDPNLEGVRKCISSSGVVVRDSS